MKNKNLLLGKWECIVSQEGNIDKSSMSENYIKFHILSLVNNLWFDIGIIEKMDDEFFLSVYLLNEPPIPSLPKDCYPLLKEIEKFPPDCRLDYLKEYGASKIECSILESSKDHFICEGEMIIHSGNGYKFKIEPSEDVWGCLEISMMEPCMSTA